MARLTIMCTKNDNKFWLVSSDGQIVAEIESEAIAADGTSPDMSVLVDVRAHAASHMSFSD